MAGDLFWYPEQVDEPPAPSQAPDAMVVLGRPQGDRGSYKQWQEENIAPQVVFEILSPSNSAREMLNKQAFLREVWRLRNVLLRPGIFRLLGAGAVNP